MAEKRGKPRSERVTLTQKVKLSFPKLGSFIDAYSANISQGGMFLQTDKLHAVGSQVLIEIELFGGKERLRIISQVAWRREPGGDGPSGMGVRFTKLESKTKAVIQSIVDLNRHLTGEVIDWTKDPTPPPPPKPAPDPPDVVPETKAAAPKEEGSGDGLDSLIGGTVDFGDDDEGDSFDDILRASAGKYADKADEKEEEPKPDKTREIIAPEPKVESKPAEKPKAKPKEKAKPKQKAKAKPKPTTDGGKRVVIGIDLGTTNSCSAYVENGIPKVIPSSLGYTTIPSMVALNHKQKLVVGQVAYDQIVTNPQNTIYGSKRLVGRPFNSPIVQQMRHYFTYQVVEGDDHLAAVQLGERVLNLPEVSALILAEIKDVAEGTLEQEVSDAVISVPAHYNDNQRNAVKRAGELAGLNVLRIINEPTAASLAYGFNRQLDQKILVYDLGGGTFDVSVLELAGNVFRVVATGGDTFLGGADFDRRIIFDVIRRFKEERGFDLTKDKVALQRVKNAAEKAKKDLSFQDEIAINLPYIGSLDNKPIDLVMTMKRTQIEKLTTDLIRRTLDITNRVLQAKGLNPGDIDEVLLVGGQTRMPLVRQMAEAYFGKEPRKGVHPDEVVALGTALLADSLTRESLVQLQDVLSMPIGIALPGGRFKPIIDKNSPLPFRKDYKLSNINIEQKKLEIDIYQGEGDKIIDNEYLGTFIFDFDVLPPGQAKKHQLAMTFKLDEESILTIVATDLRTNKSIESTMTTKDTPDSLKEAVRDAAGEGGKDKGWLKDYAKRLNQ